MATTFDIYKEYDKLAPIFFASTGLAPFYLARWDVKYPLDLDAAFKKLASTMKKMRKYAAEDDWDEDALNLMDTFSLKIIRWMQWAKWQGNEAAKNWLDKNNYLVLVYFEQLAAISPEPPFNVLFWQELANALDRRSGLLFDLDKDMKNEGIMSNAYLYDGWYFSFKFAIPSGLRARFTVATGDAQDNRYIISKIVEYFTRQKKTRKMNVIDNQYGQNDQTLELSIPHLDISKPDTYAKASEEVQSFVNSIEEAIQELDFEQLNQMQLAPYVDVQAANIEQITEERDWGYEITSRVNWRYGAFLIQSGRELRKAVMAAEELILSDWEIKAEDLREDYEEEWVFPDNEMGKKVEELFDENQDFEEIERFLGQEPQNRRVSLSGELMVKFAGFFSEDIFE